MLKIYFWQRIISPHMADLAISLSERGYDIVYIAQKPMSSERSALGWIPPELKKVDLRLASTNDDIHNLAQKAPEDAMHICQGVRANGMVNVAQSILRKRKLQYWVIMETVDDTGWRGILKRLEYSRLFRLQNRYIQGILANGHRTAEWISARGFSKSRIFPFAYFLPSPKELPSLGNRQPGPYRFIFVGQFIQRKRVTWLINALSSLKTEYFELWLVGAGPEENELRLLAKEKLDQRVRWLGQLKLSNVPAVIAQADCLVLPSVHDGWGAVASEALMVGTPVVCSDACGVAGAVRSSQCGGVFRSLNYDEFSDRLQQQLEQGPIDKELRMKIIDWAKCLNAEAGAEYLRKILIFSQNSNSQRPIEPWHKPNLIKIHEDD